MTEDSFMGTLTELQCVLVLQYLVYGHDFWETSQQAFVFVVCLQQEVKVFLRLEKVKDHQRSDKHMLLSLQHHKHNKTTMTYNK